MACDYIGRGTSHKGFRVLTPYDPNNSSLSATTGRPGVGPGNRTLSDAGAYCHRLSDFGVENQNSSSHVIFTPVDKSDLLALRFYAIADDGSDPNDLTGEARVWMMKRTQALRAGHVGSGDAIRELIGRHCFDLALTCGDTALASGSVLFPPNAKAVDTIVVTNDETLSPSARVTNDQADAWARVSWDKESDEYLVVEITGDGGTPSSRFGAVLEHI